MVRRELAALLGLAITAPTGGKDDGAGLDHMLADVGPPAVLDRLERAQRGLREGLHRRPVGGVAQRNRDRVPGAVAHLQQPLPGGAAALREAVAAVLARELDAELFEPVDRPGR